MNRDSKYSELPSWVANEDLDEEMKRQLTMKDKPKGERDGNNRS